MEEFFKNSINVLGMLQEQISDALIDTLYVIPFLFLTYLVLEFIEHKMSKKSQKLIKKAGVAGPAVGSLLGLIPQCGFSSAASTFYAGRVITVGTLIAVYLSTSDEMIPIFIAGGIPVQTLIALLVFKFVVGMIFGFGIDFILRLTSKSNNKFINRKFIIHDLCDRDRCYCDNKHDKNILMPAIIHTLQVTLFVFMVMLAVNIIIELNGGIDNLSEFINGNKFASVAAAGLVGLIPNCAASVVISQLYVNGVIGAGALVSGLLSASGVGLIVLFRSNRPFWLSCVIAVALLTISILVGFVVCLVA